MLPPLLFITIFFTLFLLMHLYFYQRLPRKNLYIKLLLLGLFLSPIFIRLSDQHLSPKLTFLIGFCSLFWMGFLLYFVVIDLVLRLFIKRPHLSLILAFLLSIYSYVETLTPEVHYITIYSPKIPPGKSLKILHISDLHLGPVMGLDKVSLVKRAQEIYKPDLIVSTGDLVDGNMKNRAFLAKALREIEAPFGKYAVLGNHEYYRGLEPAIAFTEASGFMLLKGDFFYVTPYIILVGLDDDDCQYFGKCKGSLKAVDLFKSLPRDKFILLLKHKPKIEPEAIGLFDLMLSGHTHGGLYYPIGKWLLKFLLDLEYPGFHVLSPSGYLFVSKGLGTGGPPMRFLTPPDLAIIELKAGPYSYHLNRPIPLDLP